MGLPCDVEATVLQANPVERPAAQFPRLLARLGTASASYAAGPDNSFEFGLEAILNGLETQL